MFYRWEVKHTFGVLYVFAPTVEAAIIEAKTELIGFNGSQIVSIRKANN
jgi:hypothetical protein